MDIEHTEYLEGIMLDFLEYLSVMPFCSPSNLHPCAMLLGERNFSPFSPLNLCPGSGESKGSWEEGEDAVQTERAGLTH